MSDRLLETLREKTGEGDLDIILKPSIGGYTKKSVMEYLALVKKQQQGLKDAYLAEVQRLTEERDAALEESARVRETVTAECRAEAERQLLPLREEHAALEKDMDEAIARIRCDEEKIKTLEEKLADARQWNEQEQLYSSTHAILLDSAQSKADSLAQQLAAGAEEIEWLRESEKHLREELAAEKESGAQAQIRTLMENVEQLQAEVALRKQALRDAAQQAEALTRQEAENHRALESAQAELARRREQNEWMDAENAALGQALREQLEHTVEQSREIARLKAANAALQRQLEAAHLRQND